MRTEDEIVNQIKEIEKSGFDFFGVMRGDLLQYLPLEKAIPFLSSRPAPDKWMQRAVDVESIKHQIASYMDFAWNKANECRGLSAGRSIQHIQAWLWMLGEEQASREIEDYSQYGKPQLRAICEHFGLDWKQWDDGNWRNNEDEEGAVVDAAKLTWNAP